MTERRRITIVNQHTNNFGDDAAGLALVQRCFTELHATRVDVFYIWDQDSGGLPIDDPRVRHHHLPLLSGKRDARPELALAAARQWLFRKHPHRGLRSLIETAAASDFVLVSPAGSNLGIYKDWTYALVLTALIMAGNRPTFVQNTIGRSNSRVFDFVARYILKRSELSVREAASQRWLASNGLSAYLGVDTALLLDIDPSTPSGNVLSVVPTNLSSWHRDFKSDDDAELWRDALAEGIARSANEAGATVRVVPHLYGPHAEPIELQKFAEAVRAHGCTVEIAAVATLSEYASELGRANVVVSMRYHGLILAAAQGVPCVSLAYENKMVEAATYLGQQDLGMSVREVSTDSVVEAVRRARARRAEISQSSSRTLANLVEIARGPLLSLKSRMLRQEPERHR